MIPETDTLLNISAGKLLMEIAPAMPPGYGQGSTSTVAMVLALAAQEYAKGADTRIWENARMAGLLAAYGEPAGVTAASNTIPDLNAANNELKKRLIALHGKVEGETGSKAREAERAILAFLKDSSERRRLYLPAL
ncbi:MAG: hypothetical protein QM698_03510 [Micropepsaceae bacterium]